MTKTLNFIAIKAENEREKKKENKINIFSYKMGL